MRPIRPSILRTRLVALGVAALLVACGRQEGPVVLLSEPIEVQAVPVLGGTQGQYEIEIRRPGTTPKVRTLVTDLDLVAAASASGTKPGPVDVLRQRIHWNAPYLFVREANGGGNAARADVDHVYKLAAPDRLAWIGTVSARSGAPGSQLRDGRFHDLYDRLEFTPLTTHALAPVFTLVMEEKEERFVVDLDRTWAEGRARFQSALDRLKSLGNRPVSSAPLEEPAKREIRGLALQTLALARYCRRIAEYDASLDAARALLGEIDEIQEAVGAIRPGELSPGLEEILRLRPALRTVFEAPPTGEAPAPAIPTRPTLQP